MSEGRAYSGSCLCGSVAYRFDGPISGVVCCHCTQCRKQTGHHFAAVVVARERFTLERDRTLAWFNSSGDARRGFCNCCGSVLFWERSGLQTVDVLAGGIDGPLGVGVEAHVHVDNKGDYYEICGDARQYPASR